MAEETVEVFEEDVEEVVVHRGAVELQGAVEVAREEAQRP